MNSIRNILAVTDFSSGAAHATQRAAMLASERGARMKLLHVVEPDGLVTLRDWLARGRDLRAAVAEQAAMQLDAHAGQIGQEHGVQIDRLVRVGRALDEVHEASIPSDLVVLGARGNQAVRDAALGTLADRLVRTSDRPVLVVKRPPARPYKCALVLTDFSVAAEAALRAMLAVAPDAAMHVLHAFEVPFEGKLRLADVSDEDIAAYRAEILAHARGQMQQALAGVHAADRARSEVVLGDIHLEALRAIDRLQPDVVAVGKQGDSLLEDMLLGSTTSCMLDEADCDVLVVPRRAAGV